MRADHLMCRRGWGVEIYTHHGIDLGDGRVIHYTGGPGRRESARIEITSFQDFSAGDPVEAVAYGICDEPDVVIARAMSRLGESSYNLLGNNCEHFSRWCKTGSSVSDQVLRRTGQMATPAIAGIGSVAAIGAVSTAGTVAGLSGAGVMSGLAAVGGGSAAGGLAVLGAAPAIASTVILNRTVFRYDEHTAPDERAACQAAQLGTAAGTVVGTAAAIGAVSAAGTAGLSAAGITSGLAAMGGVVGGGMVAGVGVAVAAPVVAAVAVGAAVYGLVRLFRGLW